MSGVCGGVKQKCLTQTFYYLMRMVEQIQIHSTKSRYEQYNKRQYVY